MTPIADMVERMISGGIPPEFIVLAVRTAELARGPDPTAERRRAYDRERKRKEVGDGSGGIPVEEKTEYILDNNITTQEEKKHNPRARENTWPLDFEVLFWREYPRKVGKQAAAKKLRAIWKSDKVAWDVLISAVRLFAKENAQTERRFIAHPLTWLNAGRWEDEEPQPQIFAAGTEVSGRIFVMRGDPAWDSWATKYREEKGHDPPVGSSGGWWFPREAA